MSQAATASDAGVSSKLGPVFEKCRAEKRAALIGYLPVGFPTVDESLDSFRTMVEAGCDIIEVGVPYSDPVMDGPTIQDAADMALRNGVRVRDVFRAVETIASAGGSSVVMSYWNPVLQYGVENFSRDLAAAGGAGASTTGGAVAVTAGGFGISCVAVTAGGGARSAGGAVIGTL